MSSFLCNRHHAQLFTIVVKSVETGFGIPVAFLMTKSTEQCVFQKWFSGLIARMWNDFRIAYHPDVVVTDQGNVEILAIRSAFPNARIHYCAWHVLRAWERRLTNANLGFEGLSVEMRERERGQVLYYPSPLLHHLGHWPCLITYI